MEHETQDNTQQKLLATAAVLVVVTILVLGVKVLSPKKQSVSATGVAISAPSTPTTAATNASTAVSSNATYKDGTYSATGSYESPGGTESISVTLMLKGGTITDSSVQPQATDGDSQEYQDMFVSGYKQYVVGQKVDGLRLSRVSGSSLTPQGFNDALQQIKSQAQG